MIRLSCIASKKMGPAVVVLCSGLLFACEDNNPATPLPPPGLPERTPTPARDDNVPNEPLSLPEASTGEESKNNFEKFVQLRKRIELLSDGMVNRVDSGEDAAKVQQEFHQQVTALAAKSNLTPTAYRHYTEKMGNDPDFAKQVREAIKASGPSLATGPNLNNKHMVDE